MDVWDSWDDTILEEGARGLRTNAGRSIDGIILDNTGVGSGAADGTFPRSFIITVHGMVSVIDRKHKEPRGIAPKKTEQPCKSVEQCKEIDRG